MQVIEKNSLFAQVSGEQSAVVSGGNFADAAAWQTVATALIPAGLGTPALIASWTVLILGDVFNIK